MGLKIGDILRVRTWDHHTGGARFTFGLGRQPKDQKTVMVMLMLGEEPFDETKPGFDLEQRMNQLGWFREPTKS